MSEIILTGRKTQIKKKKFFFGVSKHLGMLGYLLLFLSGKSSSSNCNCLSSAASSDADKLGLQNYQRFIRS